MIDLDEREPDEPPRPRAPRRSDDIPFLFASSIPAWRLRKLTPRWPLADTLLSSASPGGACCKTCFLSSSILSLFVENKQWKLELLRGEVARLEKNKGRSQYGNKFFGSLVIELIPHIYISLRMSASVTLYGFGCLSLSILLYISP